MVKLNPAGAVLAAAGKTSPPHFYPCTVASAPVPPTQANQPLLRDTPTLLPELPTSHRSTEAPMLL